STSELSDGIHGPPLALRCEVVNQANKNSTGNKEASRQFRIANRQCHGDSKQWPEANWSLDQHSIDVSSDPTSE
ncbi:hypothetical protein HAX54_008646, partial [Datura stramonium]|nr:hypothetical protein [Datura stramonium]